ncbi:class I SAM-dependent methyltransferase [Actinoplanes sp. NPDC051343]|uniref:class I SAM-dependent methyltransferase n=1 Tax=Actinoplanes sp. NPDC051343 TaxID=3363906 RepID=UPI003793BF82
MLPVKIVDVDDHASSFGPVADVYERGRPTYPAAALDWLLEPPPSGPRVIDLGAGTGKLTRLIRDRELPVTAVEPSPGMRAQLSAVLPDVTVVEGSAESMPLPSGSADIVLVAQAWHWVDPARAVPEVARVLAPGGRLGLLWNVRDDRADWVRRLDEIIGNRDRLSDRGAVIGAPFGPVTRASFPWVHTIGPSLLLDLVASRSAVILLPADERAALLREVRQLMATHPDLVGRTEFALPYVTYCTRTGLKVS